MSSTNYQIQFDSLSAGGDDTSSSASYSLRDSVGSGNGASSSSSYSLQTGYRSGIYDPTVSYTALSEDRSTQVAATLLASTTITVTTSSGYNAGDFIVLIQDEGENQVEAMGKITSTTATTLTVDSLTYRSSLPTINGSNDYVYKLRSGALSLSTLAYTVVSTGILAWNVNADVSNGYSMYIFQDHDLTYGSYTIHPVNDGAVTAGFSEYGGRSSDTSLSTSTFDTADTAFSTSPKEIASRSANAFQSRDFLTLKGSVTASQVDGAYTQTLTLVFVGNY